MNSHGSNAASSIRVGGITARYFSAGPARKCAIRKESEQDRSVLQFLRAREAGLAHERESSAFRVVFQERA
jgi:hypothetical protein